MSRVHRETSLLPQLDGPPGRRPASVMATEKTSKYRVEYGIKVGNHVIFHYHDLDTPLGCEQFLTELLKHGFKIHDVKLKGVSLSKPDFTGIVKNAANRLASEQICASLDIDPEEERFRFGFTD